MSPADRNKFLSEAVDRLDHATLRAVLGAPAYLSGMTGEEQKMRTRMYHTKAVPQVEKRLRVMRQARDMLTDRGGLVFSQMEKAIGASYARVKTIREAHSRATTALNFDNL